MMQVVCELKVVGELKVLGALQVKYLLKIKGTPLGYLREVFLVMPLPPHASSSSPPPYNPINS